MNIMNTHMSIKTFGTIRKRSVFFIVKKSIKFPAKTTDSDVAGLFCQKNWSKIRCFKGFILQCIFNRKNKNKNRCDFFPVNKNKIITQKIMLL